MTRRRTLTFDVVLALLLAAATLLLFEAAYRFQFVDTYRPELQAFNDAETLDGTGRSETILALGDSFTAGRGGYVDYLRAPLPGRRLVNAGISGTGVAQALIVAPRRLREFEPSVVIYQVYVGNDLFDLRYPQNLRRVSLARNL